MPAPMTSARTSRERLEEALSRIADPKGEGARACLTVYAESARAAADAADARAKAGTGLGPLDGMIVSIKDLFDVAGEPTRAGSTILADAKPALADAPVIQRLRAAGAVIIARTNMSEFAFSGVGYNPHYGTPGNPADRTRVPGGSTSGGAVSVADGMCEITIGTDTGGSTRIPAALCGLVGFKPSKARVPTDGAFPLSYSLDSIGPIARTVADCAKADAILAGDAAWTLEATPLKGLKMGIPQGMPLRDLDTTVTARFSESLKALTHAGVSLSDETIPFFDDMARVSAKVSLSPIEAFSIHRQWMDTRATDYDPFVRARIEAGRNISAADYITLLRSRADLIKAMDAYLKNLDVLVLPTTPIVAPKIADMTMAESFNPKNVLLLRNTAWVNFYDLCAISLPMPHKDGLHTGLMLVARNGNDRQLLRIAAGVERVLAG
jgi:aspartyl-tRNA(Asn)/glutamyl-tRNA(Gln) amidotransferase subunit A